MVKKYRVTPKTILATSFLLGRDYDKSGELTPAYEHELADQLETVVLKYFETHDEPYFGAPTIAYNGFRLEFNYTFCICADPPRSWHYPELYLKEGASKNQFKSEIDDLLFSEGFSKCKFNIRNNQFVSIYFER
jgi:hypothetical protein